MADPAAPTFSAAQLEELLPLIETIDTIELKLTVPESDRRSAVTALDMDPLEAQIRQIVFFDTPDLALYEHGVVLRARRVQDKPGDTVVKLRPVVPADLPVSVWSAPGFGVEVDAMPGGFVCSASMKAELDDAKVRETFQGKRSLTKLFTAEQREFFSVNAPEGVSLSELSTLGPINVLKLKFTPDGLGRRVVAELWNYPDGSRLLELSTKCASAEAFAVAAETKAYLSGRGIDVTGEQQTKTRTALEFFARELAAAPAG